MGKENKFSLKATIKSFGFAMNGFKIMLSKEHNFRIHLVITTMVIIAGLYFKLSTYEWISILLCVGMVLALEIVNSSIEHLANVVSSEKNEGIKKVKDLAAASVLIAAIIAAVVGFIIFVPYIKSLFSK